MMSRLTVFSGANEPYAIALCACLTSMLRLASKEIHIIVLDGGISEPSWSRLEKSLRSIDKPFTLQRAHPDLSRFSNFPTLRCNVMAYARFHMDILTDQAEVIYLDSDTLVQTDIVQLFDFDLKGSLLAAVQDPLVPTFEKDRVSELLAPDAHKTHYFNSGVLKVSLQQWRQIDLTRACINLIDQNPSLMQFHDQSALNYHLIGKWAQLPSTWNTSAYSAEAGEQGASLDANIIHFLGYHKPWLYGSHKGPAADLFYKALEGTEWQGWRPSGLRYQLKKLKLALSGLRK